MFCCDAINFLIEKYKIKLLNKINIQNKSKRKTKNYKTIKEIRITKKKNKIKQTIKVSVSFNFFFFPGKPNLKKKH